MTWEELKSELTFEQIVEAIERDWPDHDWCVQRIQNAIERDRKKGKLLCDKHRGVTHFATILPPEFLMTRGREGDRFVGFSVSPLEALQKAYANLIDNSPDIPWQEYQERRRKRRGQR